MSAEARLAELGIELPEPNRPLGTYRTCIRSDNQLWLAGHGPITESGFMQGVIGDEYSVEDGYDAARLTCLHLLSTMREELGSLDEVEQVVRVFGMVRAVSDFTDHPRVVNGCSDLLVQIFGDRGYHARAAVGMHTLPMGIPVEIEMMVTVKH
jgi:enamine deaminase RidA (YjgF/YER057c/UK114 family)